MYKTSKPEITLYRGWEEYGRHVWSPFVIKLETRLRFAGLKYKTEAGNPTKAPKGKIPYVECTFPPAAGDGSGAPETVTASDSSLIPKALSEWGVIPDMNAKLSPTLKAQDLAMRALLEDKLYFYGTWERWTQNYYTMRDYVLWSIGFLPLRAMVGLLVYRKTTANLHGQGTGRYTADEIASFRLEVWQSFSDVLTAARANSESSAGTEPFWALGGSDPSELDTSLFGFIVSVLMSAAAPDSRKVVRGFPVLVDYANRIHDRYFPDYEKWQE